MDESKLAGIASGATQNASDADLRDRATHTGSQAISTVMGLQTALDAKSDTSALAAHTSDTANPHGVTKTQVGLGNVDNTSDADKPVSTATQAALDTKVDKIATLSRLYRTGTSSSSLSYTASAAVDTIVYRSGTDATTSVGTPTSSTHATTKAYVDARIVQGTGFPNGAVTANVGTIYIDTAVTNGASSWIKKSGTGNTGWSVLEGDTGWRNVTALAPSGNVISGTFSIRRIGENVMMSLQNLVLSGPNTVMIDNFRAVLGTGFEPIENQNAVVRVIPLA